MVSQRKMERPIPSRKLYLGLLWFGITLTACGSQSASPFGLAADQAGNLFVIDPANHVVHRITLATRVQITVAGIMGIPGSDDGHGSTALFKAPWGAAADGAGGLYVADRGNHTIRRIELATRQVTTLAGSPGLRGNADGDGSAARFNYPSSVAADRAGNLFVADTGSHTIRRIELAAGRVTTLAGAAGIAGWSDGIGATAQFFYPRGLAADAVGNLYVADSDNGIIRKVVVATGVVTTVVGMADSWGSDDGVGSAARFEFPSELTADDTGSLFVSDSCNSTIRRVELGGGRVTTLAGQPDHQGSEDGLGRDARFGFPAGIAADGAGSLYVADGASGAIRKVEIGSGQVTTLEWTRGWFGRYPTLGAGSRAY